MNKSKFIQEKNQTAIEIIPASDFEQVQAFDMSKKSTSTETSWYAVNSPSVDNKPLPSPELKIKVRQVR